MKICSLYFIKHSLSLYYTFKGDFSIYCIIVVHKYYCVIRKKTMMIKDHNVVLEDYTLFHYTQYIIKQGTLCTA